MHGRRGSGSVLLLAPFLGLRYIRLAGRIRHGIPERCKGHRSCRCSRRRRHWLQRRLERPRKASSDGAANGSTAYAEPVLRRQLTSAEGRLYQHKWLQIPIGEPRRSPIFKFRSRGCPESARSAGRSGAMIASTASASRDREHDIRDRLVQAPPYTEERGRPEGQLREVRDERERCRDR
jgi:hypothetical protein